MAFPVRLPIVKYSLATGTLPSDAGFRWTHVGKPNMFVVFDSIRFGVPSPGVCLKVMLEAETLEFVQLEHLCRTATNLSSDYPHAGSYLLKSHPHAAAVIRSPRLAMTFRQDDGSARRFQVRFGNDDDFEAALHVLRSLKCPVTSALDRPSTAQESSYPSAPRSKSGARPATAGSGDVFALPAVPTARQYQPHVTHSPMRLLDSSTVVQPSDDTNFRGSLNDFSLHHGPDPSLHFQRPYTSPHSTDIQPLGFSASAKENVAYETCFNRPSSSRSFFNVASMGNATLPTPVISRSTARPLTAPISSLPESLSQVLPQRRELPFDNRRPATSSVQATNGSPLKPLDANAILSPTRMSPQRGGSGGGPVTARRKDASSHMEPDSSRNNAKRKGSNIEMPRIFDDSTLRTDSYDKPRGINEAFISPRQTANEHVAQVPEDSESIKMLREYAKKPSSERQALIDAMLGRYISDDAFLTLCEDIENSWRRIGFDTQR